MFGKQSSIVCNMRLYPLFICAALSLLFSCKSETDTDITRLDGTFDDNFLESWEYIILEEDNPDAMLGEVNQEIRYDDGLFFIYSEADKTSIKVFDRTGRYLNDIGRIGRGRTEVLSHDFWTLDINRNEVLIAQSAGYPSTVTIKRYDYTGMYLGQTQTESLGENCLLRDLAKVTSDGTILIQDNLVHPAPTHEYYNIRKDGSISPFLDLTGCHMNQPGIDLNLFMQTREAKADMTVGRTTLDGVFNPCSDTTYVIRKMDNNIYRLYGDKAECITKMSFLPDAPDRFRNGGFDDWDLDEEFYSYSIGFFMDMKDYLYIYNYEDIYIFNKADSKMFRMDPDTIHAKFPNHRFISVYGNDIISCVDVFLIKDELEFLNSKDYDHRYAPEVEAFYRKVKDCSNPPIIIGHYKSRR